MYRSCGNRVPSWDAAGAGEAYAHFETEAADGEKNLFNRHARF